MRRIRKIGCILLVVVLIFIVPVYSSAQVRANYGISYWYSSANSVYFRDKSSSVSVYCQSEVSAIPASGLQTSVQSAQSLWSTLGLSYTTASSASGADIIVRGVTETTAGNYGISASLDGYTSITSASLTSRGYALYDADGNGTISTSEMKEVKEITGGISIFLLDHYPVNSNSNYRNHVVIHEFTHGLGYYGHYNASSVTLMQADQSQYSYTNTLSTAERNHLRQIYNLYG